MQAVCLRGDLGTTWRDAGMQEKSQSKTLWTSGVTATSLLMLHEHSSACCLPRRRDTASYTQGSVPESEMTCGVTCEGKLGNEGQVAVPRSHCPGIKPLGLTDFPLRVQDPSTCNQKWQRGLGRARWKKLPKESPQGPSRDEDGFLQGLLFLTQCHLQT